MAHDRPVEGILKDTQSQADREKEVSVDDLTEAIGHRGYGPFLFLPALLVMTPVGGVPFVPSILAAIILIFAAQIVLGRSHFWLPKILRQRSVGAEKVKTSTDWLMPVAERLDKWFPGRWAKLATDHVNRLAAGLCVVLMVFVPPLEIVPFAPGVPMAAVAAFGLGMTLRDGVLMALGFVLAAMTAVSIIYFI